VRGVHLGAGVVFRAPAAVTPDSAVTPAPVSALLHFARRVFVRIRALRVARTAGSLAFTTLLGLVPLATVAFTFAARFPIFERWLETLQGFLFQHMLPGSADILIEHYREFTAKAAKLTGLSIVVIFITAALVTSTVEREINAIWGIRHGRRMAHRLVVYALGLTVGPVLVGASISATTWLLAQSVAAVPLHGLTPELLLKPAPLVFSIAALTLTYGFVPACRVSLRHALIGGTVAAVAFETAKYAFAWYLTKVPTYELVYGALAALPVFLVWIYVCWWIVLSGAVVTATLVELPGKPGKRRSVR
jgi:membrane protein